MRPHAFVAAALLAACAGSTSEIQHADLATTGLSLTIARSTYLAADVAPGGAGIRATLTVAPDKAYYARLGDAFNGAADQNPLYIAEGTDGAVERQSGDSWLRASSGILVEGVREVVLTPGKTYDVIVTLSPPIQPGTYRLQISASDVAGGDRKVVVRSATFQIR